MSEARALADSRCGAMIAAAGCGKTHLIARAVSEHAIGRELVLTRTHAGVDALRKRFAKLAVQTTKYHVDTIAGWSLRLAAAFPATSNLSDPEPRTLQAWSAVYNAAAMLLSLRPIQKLINISYSGVYVDEYQDCTLEQHAVILKLKEIVPCRLIGDPLQGIFSFGSNRIIQWDTEVTPHFAAVPGPTYPWRWVNGNRTLGEWLQQQRTEIAAGRPVNLHGAPVAHIRADDRAAINRRIWALVNDSERRVVVIRHFNNQCHTFAQGMRGTFSCIEPFDSPDFFEAAESIGGSTGFSRALALLEFSGRSMTKVRPELKAAYNAFSEGRLPLQTRRTKNIDQIEALRGVIESDDLNAVEVALKCLQKLPELIVYRREIVDEMHKALRGVISGEYSSLQEAASEIRSHTRRTGRRLPRCGAGTTLLVKGLEFDHAVVFDTEKYNGKNLYVALTRGAQSLTIVANTNVLKPAASSGR